jgi:hypothetical protein
MKTAEEWAKTLLIEPIQTNSPWHGNVKAYTEMVRQIQLDAAKWGLKQASKVCEDNDECKDAILAFAKNLTIDQLKHWQK